MSEDAGSPSGKKQALNLLETDDKMDPPEVDMEEKNDNNVKESVTTNGDSSPSKKTTTLVPGDSPTGTKEEGGKSPKKSGARKDRATKPKNEKKDEDDTASALVPQKGDRDHASPRKEDGAEIGLPRGDQSPKNDKKGESPKGGKAGKKNKKKAPVEEAKVSANEKEEEEVSALKDVGDEDGAENVKNDKVQAEEGPGGGPAAGGEKKKRRAKKKTVAASGVPSDEPACGDKVTDESSENKEKKPDADEKEEGEEKKSESNTKKKKKKEKGDEQQAKDGVKGGKKGKAKGKGKGRKNGPETGTCKWFDSQKGFGFIQSDWSGEEIFVHNSEICSDGFRSLTEGERVQFTCVVEGKRKKATNITGVSGAPMNGSTTDFSGKLKYVYKPLVPPGSRSQGKGGKKGANVDGKGPQKEQFGSGGKGFPGGSPIVVRQPFGNGIYELSRQPFQAAYANKFAQQHQFSAANLANPYLNPMAMQWMAAQAQAQAAQAQAQAAWANGNPWYPHAHAQQHGWY